MGHRRDLSVCIEGHAERLDGGRAKRVEARVVGPGQDHLDRLAESLSRKRCRHGIVAVETPAEAATQKIGAHYDLFLRQTQRLRKDRQDQALPLVAGMDLEDSVLLESERVDRL